MLKNYLLTAIRSLTKNKFSAFINVIGLAIGMACCILIFLYVRNETSYDDFHAKAERTYRLYTIDEALGVTSNSVGITMPVMPAAVKTEIPEVEKATRVLNQGRTRVEQEDRFVYAENAKYVESEFFEIFDFQLLQEGVVEAFKSPRKAVLTEAMAKKVFGDQEAVGNVVQVNDEDWEVVGLIKENNANSHLKLDLLLSLYPTLADSSFAQYLDSWQGLGMIGYVVLNDASSEIEVEGKLKELAAKNDAPSFWIPQLQPLKDIHLKSSDILFDGYNAGKGDITYVYSLSAVAFFVLLIAAFNFMNLSTAQSSSRAKEVGVRKALGAFRIHLIKQHLGESIFICLIAASLALVLTLTVGPFINLGLPIAVGEFIFGQPSIYLTILGTSLVIGILAGLYPAFVLSKFDTIRILRGKFQSGKSGIMLRKFLVVAQFAASITMIIGTVLIYRQINFIKNKDLGFDKEQVVTFQMNEPGIGQNMPAFRNRLMQLENISSASASSNMPGRTFGRTGITPEGASEDEENWIVSSLSFDENYLNLMGMEILEGRNFSAESGTDQQQAILVNEALVSQLGWKVPIGRKLTLGNGTERTIIGVVKNFHFASMRHAIEPLIMFYNPNANSNLSIKIKGGVNNTMEQVESLWQEIYPDFPMEYQFFDQEFDNVYKSDVDFSRLVVNFTWLAIFIACLGLFGLSAYMAEQRTKEIGIRKVLGSGVGGIVMLLSKEFVVLIMIATALAWPIAYWAINGWLGEFQYRIDLLSLSNIGIFAVSGFAALVIGLLTVSYQSIAAAIVNPIKSLRSE